MMFNICNHKLGKIENGYQYCEKCGKAFAVPCSHNWKILESYEMPEAGFGNHYKTAHFVVVNRCTKCGKLYSHEVD